jgi:hypothetical protein
MQMMLMWKGEGRRWRERGRLNRGQVHAGKPNHVKHKEPYSIAVTGCKWGVVYHMHRLPVVLHVLRPMRCTHERGPSCLKVPRLNGIRVYWKRGQKPRASTENTGTWFTDIRRNLVLKK